MRKVIELQMEFWKKDISQIEFDLQSRDEIPKILIGLQYIYSTLEIRAEVFKILKRIVPLQNHKVGRPGMDLWKILVLGTLRLNCNWDFDKVHEMANNHNKLRQMLGHSKTDFDSNYALQTIRDNLFLLTPEILDEVNQVVVKAGHSIIMKSKDQALKGSCDSFVVETDVHYPTDTNLLFDAVRKMISLIAIICSEQDITEWRQSHHNILKVKRLLRSIQKLKRSTSKDENKKAQRDRFIVQAHQNYIDICRVFVLRVKATIKALRDMRVLSFSQDLRLTEIEEYIHHAERQIDQVHRRVVLGQVTDEKVAVAMTQGAKDRFPNLNGCSYDKGFYSPANKKDLGKILDYVVLPKKGRLSAKDKEIQHSEEFVKSRRKHSGVESAINALENHGLDRCLDHGLHGFKRYVALSVLARNIQILGHIIQQKELKRQKRRKAA